MNFMKYCFLLLFVLFNQAQGKGNASEILENYCKNNKDWLCIEMAKPKNRLQFASRCLRSLNETCEMWITISSSKGIEYPYTDILQNFVGKQRTRRETRLRTTSTPNKTTTIEPPLYDYEDPSVNIVPEGEAGVFYILACSKYMKSFDIYFALRPSHDSRTPVCNFIFSERVVKCSHEVLKTRISVHSNMFCGMLQFKSISLMTKEASKTIEMRPLDFEKVAYFLGINVHDTRTVFSQSPLTVPRVYTNKALKYALSICRDSRHWCVAFRDNLYSPSCIKRSTCVTYFVVENTSNEDSEYEKMQIFSLATSITQNSWFAITISLSDKLQPGDRVWYISNRVTALPGLLNDKLEVVPFPDLDPDVQDVRVEVFAHDEFLNATLKVRKHTDYYDLRLEEYYVTLSLLSPISRKVNVNANSFGDRENIFSFRTRNPIRFSSYNPSAFGYLRRNVQKVSIIVSGVCLLVAAIGVLIIAGRKRQVLKQYGADLGIMRGHRNQLPKSRPSLTSRTSSYQTNSRGGTSLLGSRLPSSKVINATRTIAAKLKVTSELDEEKPSVPTISHLVATVTRNTGPEETVREKLKVETDAETKNSPTSQTEIKNENTSSKINENAIKSQVTTSPAEGISQLLAPGSQSNIITEHPKPK